MVNAKQIESAKEHFGTVLEQQLARVEVLKQEGDWTDYSSISPIEIGMLGGDGIGPSISDETQKVMEYLLRDAVSSGKVNFRVIEGLTIENRAAKMQSIPDDVLVEIKKCHVTLKGPTHTPERGDGWPNIESANVGMRKELDLFANVRPVRVPKLGIDWTFFRENTEDLYAVGSQGINVTEDLAIDFRVITTQGSRRIIDAAFAHAKRTGKNLVTIVTKANIVKTTDGKFLDMAREVSENYPGIEWDGWYIDIMTAALINPARQSQFQVLALPNLYGDILTDEAAQIQGGVGTAGSANIGKRYGMFEAIHGSAPRMVAEGRAQYADPSSLVRAGAMLLEHIGYTDLGGKLHKALDICGLYERKLVMTGRDTGATSAAFGEYIMKTVEDPNVEARWDEYVKAEA
ncbi:MAG: isocitrate/isopropylmalate dehydrogenase family protein [Chloroflexi bacterium]|nr:isocitrate/isopropylmalate dehydrogenase family protein [Chloroflexota bacterium]MCI0795858.1 isocitrate/isopropylmalate dehydrogenase family protein [Chloroflexota bacterium]MCI0822409.1 isocitrate/isopropylmalate dehydrogenase family protein [Chloroflexota bacterium]MCI0868389.1 isocitrate/isopropylmalate dehydrogenase family protein [Chloroflexota bacterium]MCI0887826.1 isocitrate/isopropylmalate dehydrogenase family protein [Chloroflexota bacterium]